MQLNHLKELEELLESPLPDDLQEIGMKHLTPADFQSIFDFIEILINVKERIRNERRNEIKKPRTRPESSKS